MFDDIDKAIVEALLNEGRASWVDIAREIGATMTTTRRRGTELVEGGPVLVSVLPTLDLFPAAHRMFEVRLQVDPGRQREVALALARRADTRWVAVVTGEFDVEAEMLVDENTDPAGALLDEIQELSGVRRTQTAPILSSETISDDWSRRGSASRRREPHECDPSHLSQADRAILNALKADGRGTFVEVAAQLQMNESTVRRRFTDMLDRGCATVITLVHPASLGYEQEVILRLGVTPLQASEARAALAARYGVHHIATMLGPENLTCEVLFKKQPDLVTFIRDVIEPLPGLQRVTAEIELLVYKRAFLLSPWVTQPT